MSVLGGDVGLEEFARHANAERLWENAVGRSGQGDDLAIWSAHSGDDTLFYRFALEARAGQGRLQLLRLNRCWILKSKVEKLLAQRGKCARLYEARGF